MQTTIFTNEELQDLKLASIGRKYNCTGDYVKKILIGVRGRKSVKSQKIVTDVIDILNIINRNPKVTL